MPDGSLPHSMSNQEVRNQLDGVISRYTPAIRFFLNGSSVKLDASLIDPEATLLDFIRSQRRLKGTKLGCGEGGCGACTVVLQTRDKRNNKVRHLPINACLAPLLSIDGKHVITIEALGTAENPHPLQERLAKLHGSQCGFCTPGIVMSIYALLRNADRDHGYRLTAADIELEGALDGNLCRCTGYAPILNAAKTFIGEYIKNKKNGDSVQSEDYMIPLNVKEGNLTESSKELLKRCCSDDSKEEISSWPSGKPFGCGKEDCCQLGRSVQPSKEFEFPTFAFREYHPNSELIYPPALSNHVIEPVKYGNKKRIWVRPANLQQLLEIKAAYPPAKIVAGSSEVQVEIKFKAAPYDVCVYVSDVAELSFFEHNAAEQKIVFGGNYPLADLETSCKNLYNEIGSEKGSKLEAIRHQLRYFAGRQIRNVACVAGNLATASPISDLNPILLACNATVVAASLKKSEQRIPLADFFLGYRKTALPSDAVISAIEIDLSIPLGEEEVVRSYKQARRRDDDIAIVTACFNVRVDPDGTVKFARLAFGGMAPITSLASKASEFLIGKKFHESSTMEGVLSALNDDFNLPHDVPGGMPTYRRTLTLSFFYKYWHELILKTGLPLAGVPVTPEVDDLLEDIRRETSVTSRDNSDPYAQETLGRQIPHTSSLLQTSGQAVYTDDIPRIGDDEVYGALVLSARAHAKITSIDPSKALDMDGVIDWVDHHDLSAKANVWGPANDEQFFATDKVISHGQPIGLIVATDKFKAQAAARAVVVEYEDLPHVISIEDAIEQSSFYAYDKSMKRGKPIEEAFDSAAHIFEGETRMGAQEHFYLETQACIAVPKLEHGEMEIWTSTQALTDTQKYVAQVCGVPYNRIVAKCKRMGGGFGGKETRSCQLACILAVAAKKTQRAVRCMLDRDVDMMTSGQRHAFLGKWKVGCDSKGKLVALQLKIFNNGGFSLDLSGGVMDRAIAHSDNVYYCPNVDVQGRVCKTNTVTNTAFRGFGGPQGMLIAESYITTIAEGLNLDVNDVRKINLYKENDTTHFLQPVIDWHLPRLWDDILKQSDYHKRRQDVDDYNKKHSWRKRGIAVVPTKFGLAYGLLHMNQGGAVVHIYEDGSVLVAHGGTEMGQGLYTKMAQVAAQELSVSLGEVFTSESATNTVPNMSATAASSGTDLNGMAVKNACDQLNERLLPYRKKMPGAPMSKIADAAFKDRVPLSATGHYAVPVIGYQWGNYIDPKPLFYYFTQGVAVAEVEVDCLTGDHIVRQVDLKMDVGRSINPAIDYGQIEGAFIQGVGLYTLEEPLWTSSNGQMFTRGPGAYKIPGFADIPMKFNVSLLRDASWPNLGTIGSSKGVGEPPLFLGASVMFALRDALKDKRKESGITETQEFRSPLTCERIRLACGDQLLERSTVHAKEGQVPFFVVT